MRVTRSLLRRIINEELNRETSSIVTQLSARDLRSMIIKEARSLLNEHTIPNTSADINDMDAGAVWDIMVGDAPGADSLFDTLGSVTGWAGGALEKAGAGDTEGLKALAEKIWGENGKSKFTANVESIVSALGSSEGYAKPDMPAFEGGDGPAVADALSEPGKINIDIGADHGGDNPDFEEYLEYEDMADEEEKDLGKNESYTAQDKLMLEQWHKMAGINELKADERFPWVGPNKVMPGAPNLGAKGEIDIDAIDGVAKKFLTKGKGNKGDDVSVAMNQTMANTQMKPTQTNVKAAKTLLFALLNTGEDMGGAFASNDGEIIDGHHRWSGQRLRTGGSAKHSGVHIIDKPAGMDTKEFLTMLTVLGTALGRPTKLK